MEVQPGYRKYPQASLTCGVKSTIVYNTIITSVLDIDVFYSEFLLIKYFLTAKKRKPTGSVFLSSSSTGSLCFLQDVSIGDTLNIHARSCFKRHPYETWTLEHKCIRWVESYDT